MKKKNWKLLFSILGVLIIFIGIAFFTVLHPKAQKKLQLKKDPEIWVISDNHFLAKSLHDRGEAFEKFNKTTVGKDIVYSEDILEAFVKKALAEKPAAIAITGDTTLNGEKISLIKMAEILKPLKKAEIPVFAIPGNHDIYDGWARKFEGDKQYLTDEISPRDFKKYFPDGYEKSISEDKFSLSYVVDFGNYRLFMMDDNLYTIEPSTQAPITQGRYKKETMAWLEEELEKGKKEGKTPLLFSHHNLLTHSKQVHNGFVLNNAEAVLDLVKKYQIPLSLSGHTHAQNILESETIPNFYEVTTSAFSISESHIGHVTLGKNQITYQGEIFDPRKYFSKEQLKNPDLKDYPTYLKNIFISEGNAMAYDELYSKHITDDKIVEPIAKLSGELNVAYFVGKVYSDKEKEEIKNSEAYKFMKEYAPRLERFVTSKLERQNQEDPMNLTIYLKK